MKIREIIKNKKFKNAAVTILEILVVAGIIFGGLMFARSKVSQEADKTTKNNVKNVKEQETKENEKADKYYIEVNQRKNIVIIYQYSKDEKSREQIKAFQSCVGKEVPRGTFKTGRKYTWLDIYQGWHKYNTELGNGVWIQSAVYKDKNDYSLSKASYNSLGKSKAEGKSILLSAKDAAWIYEHCKEGTKVSVIKGRKNDELSVSPEAKVSTYKYCGWDPTDPDKNNPYLKIKNGAVVKGLSTITTERGQEPDYLGNIIALNKKGKVITNRLKYNTIDYSTAGTYKVNYSYKAKDGIRYKISQKIKVQDTTPPKVTTGKSLYTLEVDSDSTDVLNTEKTVKAIVDMVKADVRTDESVKDIQVYTLEKEQFRVDEKAAVVIKAEDLYGNIGSHQVMCEFKVKEEETTLPKGAIEAKKHKKKTKPKTFEEDTTEKKSNRKTSE